MPAGVSAYVPLANVTLSSSAASVTFSSISQAYRDLVLVFNGATASTSGVSIRFNSDSGSNYSYVQMLGNGSTASTSAGTTTEARMVNSNGTDCVGTANIFDYSTTDKHKSVLSRGDTAAASTRAHAVRWANTNAITSLTVFGEVANINAGSTFALYGVSA